MKLILAFLTLTILPLSNSVSADNSKKLEQTISSDISDDDDDDDFEEDLLDTTYDPLEPFNRLMFSMNNCLDKAFFVPLATVYKHILPQFIQTGLSNFINTLFAPVRVINFILQGEGKEAVRTIFRFLFNLIFGFFGTCDVAKKVGLTAKETSFSDTLKKWGAGTGPYIVLPLLGPSSFRGVVGRTFQLPFEPAAELALLNHQKRHRRKLRLIMTGVDLLATRASLLGVLDDMQKMSYDPYIATRDAVMAKERANS